MVFHIIYMQMTSNCTLSLIRWYPVRLQCPYLSWWIALLTSGTGWRRTCLNWMTPSSQIRNLGVIFDSTMSMSAHVTSICKSVNFILWNISRIRKFIDLDTCNHAITAFVLSKVDYANALLAGCSKKDVARLQRLQNKAARIIYQVSRNTRPTASLLQELH